MTRLDNVRGVAGKTRKNAAQYVDEARDRAAPHVDYAVRNARKKAREGYRSQVAPRMEQAVDAASDRTRRTARRAADTAGPKLSETFQDVRDTAGPKVQDALTTARAHAEPVRDEAFSRGGAAVHVLRGEVSAAEVERLVKKQRHKRCRSRVLKGLGIAALVAGAGAAAWQLWRRQSTPDWLMEEPPPTEVAPNRGASATGSGPTGSDTPPTQVDGSKPNAANAPKQDEDNTSES